MMFSGHLLSVLIWLPIIGGFVVLGLNQQLSAARYCAWRFATLVQLEMTMSTVVNVVRKIKGMEMPSTPR